MWHHHLRRAGIGLWRLVLVCLLLAVLLLGAVLAVLGSETGSRWLLERGMAMQQVLSARYEGGTLLGGVELADVRVQTAKSDLRIRHLLARWSLWQLFRAKVDLHALELDGVDLYRLSPPSGDPVALPTLPLPLHLVIRDLQVRDARLWRWQAKTPLTLRRLSLGGEWLGTRLRFDRLHAEQERLGQLDLAGHIRLRGGYALQAQGLFDYLPFREQGWQPLSVQLDGEVADLELRLQSRGSLTATGQGRIRPLEPDLPYEAVLQWQAVTLPWWSDQSWRSDGGHLKVQGDRSSLEAQGEAQLASRHLPPGQYALKGRTDWHSASFKYINFNGLGGKAQVTGGVDWRSGLSWEMEGRLERLDLSRKWPINKLVVPPLTGGLRTTGRTNKEGSAVQASLRLGNGESWDIVQSGTSWPWNLQARQEVSLRWQGVRRQLANGEALLSENGTLHAEGSRQAYRALLDVQLGGPRLPAGQWTGELAGAERKIDIPRLSYRGAAGGLDFQGGLELGSVLQWQGRLQLADFATAWLRPDWPGRLSGELQGLGSWSAGRREFHFEGVHLQGSLRERELALDGPLDAVLMPGDWPELHSSSLRTRWGTNEAVVMGGLRDGHWDLSAQLDLRDLRLLRPETQGQVRGEIALQGEKHHPHVQASLQGEKLASRGWQAATASLVADVRALGEEDSRITLTADGLTNASGRDWGRLQLGLTGNRQQHALQWQADSDHVNGRGSLAGGLVAGGWSGRMDTGLVRLAEMEWQLASPFALSWRAVERQLRLDAHCWVSADARLCNEEEMRLGRSGHMRASLQGLQLERLAGLMPEGLGLNGLVNGSVSGSWQPGQAPVLRAELVSRQGQVRLAREDRQTPLQRDYELIALHAVADGHSVDLRFELESPDMGRGRMQARIDPRTAGKPLQGELSLQGLRLDVFQPLFPALSTLSGAISAEGRVAGLLARPQFHGRVQVEDGELGFQRLPLQIRDLDTRVEVRGTAADISGSMRSGEGSATLTGSADWGAEPWLELALKGERFQLRQPPELLAEVNPDLRLRVVPQRVDLTGSVRVPMARLNIKPLTEQAVPLSPDIRIVHSADREQALVTGRVAAWDINADIRLILGNDVHFQGYGVQSRLMGSLRLRQEGRRGLEASGEVELDKEARYDAYGQRLQIRRGRLIFAGNLTQPGLDVEAIREVDGKVVGVRVEGRANAPEAELFSDESMSQEEIVSYLVLGRPLDESGRPQSEGNPNLAAAAAAIRLGATGSAGLTSKVGETLGISDLALDAEGSGDDTQVTVSGYLSPKLYLRYGVGIFTPVNTATLRYKINSRLYLEAVSSLESAIDLFYNVRF